MIFLDWCWPKENEGEGGSTGEAIARKLQASGLLHEPRILIIWTKFDARKIREAVSAAGLDPDCVHQRHLEAVDSVVASLP